MYMYNNTNTKLYVTGSSVECITSTIRYIGVHLAHARIISEGRGALATPLIPLGNWLSLCLIWGCPPPLLLDLYIVFAYP